MTADITQSETSARAEQPVCVHCGRRPATTLDHVPPQTLFPSPRPTNLVTVPSCWPCNRDASKEDEYFRLAVSLRENTTPSAAPIRAAALRALARPQAARFARRFLAGIRPVELSTLAGLHVASTGAYNVDLWRLDRGVSRTVRGLFYRHQGRRLPDGYEVVEYTGDGIPAATLGELRETLVRPLLGCEEYRIGDTCHPTGSKPPLRTPTSLCG